MFEAGTNSEHKLSRKRSTKRAMALRDARLNPGAGGGPVDREVAAREGVPLRRLRRRSRRLDEHRLGGGHRHAGGQRELDEFTSADPARGGKALSLHGQLGTSLFIDIFRRTGAASMILSGFSRQGRARPGWPLMPAAGSVPQDDQVPGRERYLGRRAVGRRRNVGAVEGIERHEDAGRLGLDPDHRTRRVQQGRQPVHSARASRETSGTTFRTDNPASQVRSPAGRIRSGESAIAVRRRNPPEPHSGRTTRPVR